MWTYKPWHMCGKIRRQAIGVSSLYYVDSGVPTQVTRYGSKIFLPIKPPCPKLCQSAWEKNGCCKTSIALSHL